MSAAENMQTMLSGDPQEVGEYWYRWRVFCVGSWYLSSKKICYKWMTVFEKHWKEHSLLLITKRLFLCTRVIAKDEKCTITGKRSDSTDEINRVKERFFSTINATKVNQAANRNVWWSDVYGGHWRLRTMSFVDPCKRIRLPHERQSLCYSSTIHDKTRYRVGAVSVAPFRCACLVNCWPHSNHCVFWHL